MFNTFVMLEASRVAGEEAFNTINMSSEGPNKAVRYADKAHMQ